jgi:hypothetical protein
MALAAERGGLAGAALKTGGFGGLGTAFSWSANLEVSFEGEASSRLFFAVPVDNHADAGAEEGAGALALALSAIDAIGAELKQGGRLPMGLSFLFLTAENRWRKADDASKLGSAAWLEEEAGQGSSAVVYLSLDGLGQVVELSNLSRNGLSPFWFYDRTRKALTEARLPFRLDANRMQVYRLGLGDREGPLAPYFAAGVPAVELRGQAGPSGSRAAAGQGDDPDRAFLSFIHALLALNGGGLPAEWDRDYLSFQVLGSSFVLREGAYLAILLGFCAALLAILSVLSITRRQEALRLVREAPAILGQVGMVYLAALGVFVLGKAVSLLEAILTGSPDSWKAAAPAIAATRLVAALLAYVALLLILVDRRRLSPNPYFYEFAALAMLVPVYFIFSAIMPPFAFYFAWAIIFVAASLFLRRPTSTVICYLLMYAPLVLLMRSLAQDPEPSFYRVILAPGLASILLLSAATLPLFVFTASPLLFFTPPHGRSRQRLVALLLCLAALVGSAGPVVDLWLSRRGEPGLTLSETLDQDRGSYRASVKGGGRLGRLVLRREGRDITVDSLGSEARLSGQDARVGVSMRESRKAFLGRQQTSISLSFNRPPYMVELAFVSSSEMTFYDCSLPYAVSLDGRKAEVLVGASPPDPLTLDITVPEGFQAHLSVVADYLEPLSDWRPPEGVRLLPGRHRLLAGFDIGKRE